MKCLLCESVDTAAFKVVKKPERNYYQCSRCDLIFMTPEERLDAEQEKIRYDKHQNEETSGYASFLAPLVKDIHTFYLSKQVNMSEVSALDFGCGPTAVLGRLLKDKGFNISSYDPYYFPDQEVLRKTYQLVTCTEVWEHLYNPGEEIKKQLRLLKSGGLLAIMTSAHHGPAVFADWYYRRDPTHVSFFSEQTMKWIADTYELRLIKGKSPYWIFQK